MRVTILHIKVVHTIIFGVLSACVIYVVVSGAFNRITPWTWVAVGAILVEGVVLVLSGWRCPLTAAAERLGAVKGSVVDIFLPRWFADRIFPICGTLFGVGCALIAIRLLAA
jgi:hypothetical protein